MIQSVIYYYFLGQNSKKGKITNRKTSGISKQEQKKRKAKCRRL